jgi:nucleotide-binding universal stress UspA family protein
MICATLARLKDGTTHLAYKSEHVVDLETNAILAAEIFADAIIRLAETEHIDLVVIGAHSRRVISRLLTGSVAKAVVRAAPCPVITVKQPVMMAVGV